jgi:hypothetical protein
MKRAMVLLGALMFVAHMAEATCRVPQLRESVEVGPGALSLADLLPPGNCHTLYQAAARVGLGVAPSGGSERVLDGAEIRVRFEQLEAGLTNVAGVIPIVPERIVVQRAQARAPCSEVARFLAGAAPNLSREVGWQNGLHCDAARNVAAGAELSLKGTRWNPLLQRWEFVLQCRRAGECVPFLVWLAADNGGALFSTATARLQSEDAAVKRGQTAMLTWDQGGIRVVVPVMCLEPGAIGQSIRVRIENAGRTLRAEVVAAGELRVSL